MRRTWGLGLRIGLLCIGLLVLQFAIGTWLYAGTWEKSVKGIVWFISLIVCAVTVVLVVRRLLSPLHALEMRLATTQWDLAATETTESAEIASLQEAITKRAHLQHQQLRSWVDQAEALDEPLKIILNGLTKQYDTIRHYQLLVSQKLDTAAGVATAMGQTKSDAENLHRYLFDAKEQCGKALRQMQQVFQALAASKEGQTLRIERLADLLKRFDHVDEIIRRVHTINDQTKLIAFNASIEASTSGETGRRFGIVASDIRTLSQTIEESNTDMKQALGGLKEAIDSIVGEARSDAGRAKDSVAGLGDNLTLLAKVFAELEKAVATSGHLVSHADHRKKSAHTIDETMRAMSENAWTLAESARTIDQEMKTIQARFQSMTSTF